MVHNENTVDRDSFRERLLEIMERKHHWAWPGFTSGMVPRELLPIHLEQEYATYVRDFPRLIGRAYVQCPIPEVRRELAENLYEEETGGLEAGRPHPELFLEIARGLGCDLDRFNRVELLPGAAKFRQCLDSATRARGWEVGTAVVTIFVEGTPYERGELDPSAPKRPTPPLYEHPLVVHYGLPVESLALTRAHRNVEGEHRSSAWKIVLDHVSEDKRSEVAEAMELTLDYWLGFRDDVAHACGLVRNAKGQPQLHSRSCAGLS